MAKISSLLILTSNYLFSFGFTFGEFLSIHSMAAKQIEVLCLKVSSPPYLLLFLIFLPPMRFAHGKVLQVCPWVTAMPQQYLLPCGSSMHLSQNVFPLVSCSFRLLLFLTWVLTQATCSGGQRDAQRTSSFSAEWTELPRAPHCLLPCRILYALLLPKCCELCSVQRIKSCLETQDT